MSDLITISSSVVPESARVVGFRGTEAISKPYELEIYFTIPLAAGEEFDLNDAIGAKARLLLDRSDDKYPPFVFAGILASVELLQAHDGRALIRAALVPRLWQLRLSTHSRIFTNMTVPDILQVVLEENGVMDVELRLGAYEPEEHVCQYRESDLDFISRWMEREGIFYFFEHSEEGERLILCDHKVYNEDSVGLPVRFFPQLGQDSSAGASLRSFTCRHTTLPASVRLRDYDYIKPGLTVGGAAKVAANGAGEVSSYGDRFFTPAAGDKLARVRAEELLARQVVYFGVGTRLHLRPGYKFELEEHPFPSFNAQYVTIAAHHSGNQSAGMPHFRELSGITHDDVYHVEIEAIPGKTQFRAERRAAWPRIYGFENAVIDGSAVSDYAQIDDHGRYRVKIKFDEGTLKDGKASTWVRMMQPHGGDIEGFHFPLRKGTEVLLSFLGGDCDRPVISGVVPNAVTPSAVTQANYTKNIIQTGARNRLELEDKAGSEWIRVSTPYAGTFLNMGLAFPLHELTVHTDQNALIDAQQAFDITVAMPPAGPTGEGNMTVTVKNNLTTTIENVNLKTQVKAGDATFDVDAGTLTETIYGDTTRHIVNGNLKTDVDTGNAELNVKTGTFTETIEGTTERHVKTGDLKTNVDTGLRETNIKGDSTDTVQGNSKRRTDGTADFLSGGLMTIKTDEGSNIEIEADEVKITSRSDKTVTIMGKEFEYKNEDSASITIGSSIDLKAGWYNISCSATGLDVGISATGAKLSLDLTGFSFSLEAALALSLNLGIGWSNKAASIDLKMFDMEEVPVKLGLKAEEAKTGVSHNEIYALIVFL